MNANSEIITKLRWSTTSYPTADLTKYRRVRRLQFLRQQRNNSPRSVSTITDDHPKDDDEETPLLANSGDVDATDGNEGPTGYVELPDGHKNHTEDVTRELNAEVISKVVAASSSASILSLMHHPSMTYKA